MRLKKEHGKATFYSETVYGIISVFQPEKANYTFINSRIFINADPHHPAPIQIIYRGKVDQNFPQCT